MIFMQDSIGYENVISMRDKFYYLDMKEHLLHFIENVKKIGGHPTRGMFYSLNNIPMDKIMKVEFFMPIQESELEIPERMRFHSYFGIEHMMATRVTEDFNNSTEKAYAMMFELMKEKNLKQVTPPFHMVNRVKGRPVVTIKIGYIEGKSEE